MRRGEWDVCGVWDMRGVWDVCGGEGDGMCVEESVGCVGRVEGLLDVCGGAVG